MAVLIMQFEGIISPMPFCSFQPNIWLPVKKAPHVAFTLATWLFLSVIQT